MNGRTEGRVCLNTAHISRESSNMSDPLRFERATDHLQAAYGRPCLPTADSTWALALQVLFGISTGHHLSPVLNEILRSPPLVSPTQTVSSTTGHLVEVLNPIPRGPQKSSVVRAMAAWWIEQFGDEISPQWSKGLDFYRVSLRTLRGLGPSTVDELLLFAARLNVFPLDRSALRVAVRHGWLALPLEEEEAQLFFIDGLKQAKIDPREFSSLLSKVGENHCGREPICDGCALQALLPTGGPLSPESC